MAIFGIYVKFLEGKHPKNQFLDTSIAKYIVNCPYLDGHWTQNFPEIYASNWIMKTARFRGFEKKSEKKNSTNHQVFIQKKGPSNEVMGAFPIFYSLRRVFGLKSKF